MKGLCNVGAKWGMICEVVERSHGGPVGQVCSPSYLRRLTQEDVALKLAWATVKLYLKKQTNKTFMHWVVGSTAVTFSREWALSFHTGSRVLAQVSRLAQHAPLAAEPSHWPTAHRLMSCKAQKSSSIFKAAYYSLLWNCYNFLRLWFPA